MIAQKASPRTSVIVLTFNGMAHVRECIDSLINQTNSDHEILIIDNGSKDGTPEWIETHYPQLNLIRLRKNIGFCKGMNVGVQRAKGHYVFLLNQDVKIERNCIRELVDILDQKSEEWIGAFPKVHFYDAPMYINAYGTDWYETCQWRDTRVGLADLGQFKEPEQVFGSIFPAVMFNRAKFLEIGAFDNMFWSYNE
ncbi:glycosyltransferase, partial [bacterium]|nr:glycosyltransferase [candidate division CSSED10-310 bacterium]